MPRIKRDSNPGRNLEVCVKYNSIEKIHDIVKLMSMLSVCVAQW